MNLDIMFYGTLISFVIFFIYFTYFLSPKREKKDEEEKQAMRKKQDEEHRKREEKWQMEKYLPSFFGVEMGNNLEDREKAYDEIVRLVNLEAIKTAQACVKQDKVNRKAIDDLSMFYEDNLNYNVADLKESWAKMRNNALELCPDLKDRMPHFSEFEPLKSYNAEHLLKKKVNN